MRILILSFVLALLTHPLVAQSTFFFSQIADGTIPGIRFETSFIFVNTGAAGEATLEFFDSQSQPIDLTLVSGQTMMGPDSSFTISLAPGESYSAQTPGTGTFQFGYARLTASDGIGGTAVFTRSDPDTGIIFYEAGVPAAPALTSFSLFVDSVGSKDTGLAIVSPPVDGGAPDANLMIRLQDKQFTEIATTPVPLPTGQHMSRFVSQFFSSDMASLTDNIEGTLTVESDRPVAAVTLRQNDDPAVPFPDEVPTLTTFPVVAGVAGSAGTGTFSLLSAGEVGVSLDLSSESRTVVGAIYLLYAGDIQVGEVTRGISSSDQVTHTLPVEDSGQVTHVEAKLIYAGGHLSSSFPLLP